jgi:hypothetical protein
MHHIELTLAIPWKLPFKFPDDDTPSDTHMDSNINENRLVTVKINKIHLVRFFFVHRQPVGYNSTNLNFEKVCKTINQKNRTIYRKAGRFITFHSKFEF